MIPAVTLLVCASVLSQDSVNTHESKRPSQEVVHYFESIRADSPIEIGWSIEVFDEAGEPAYVHHHRAIASTDSLMIERVVEEHQTSPPGTTSQVWRVTEDGSEKLFPQFDGVNRLITIEPTPGEMVRANFPMIASFYPRALLEIPGTRHEPVGWLKHGGLVSTDGDSDNVEVVVTVDDAAFRRTVLGFRQIDDDIALESIRDMAAPPPADKPFEERLYIDDKYEATEWVLWRGQSIPTRMTIRTTFHSSESADRIVTGLFKLKYIGAPTAETQERLSEMFVIREGDHIQDKGLDLMYQIGGATLSSAGGIHYRLPAGETIDGRLDEAFLKRLDTLERYGEPPMASDISHSSTGEGQQVWFWVAAGGCTLCCAIALIAVMRQRRGHPA